MPTNDRKSLVAVWGLVGTLAIQTAVFAFWLGRMARSVEYLAEATARTDRRFEVIDNRVSTLEQSIAVLNDRNYDTRTKKEDEYRGPQPPPQHPR